jgi:N-acetylglutamate synthase-like GNAT family acetyltransferase
MFEKLGFLRIYTVRSAGALVGYEVFTVGLSLHYNTSFQAKMDTLFIHPDQRKGLVGYRFLKWVEQQLAAEGVEIAYRHFKLLKDGRLNLKPLFERLGWTPIYLMFYKRLKAPRC